LILQIDTPQKVNADVPRIARGNPFLLRFYIFGSVIDNNII